MTALPSVTLANTPLPFEIYPAYVGQVDLLFPAEKPDNGEQNP